MSKTLNQLLADLHKEREKTWHPDALKINVNQRKTLVADARHKRFVQTGDRVEPFELYPVEGGTLSLDELLHKGPAVLIFFRFAGCPACNISIPYYEQYLQPALQARAVSLVAISPQSPEGLLDIKQRHQLTLQVANDKDNQLARRFNILYEFDTASRNAALAKGPGIGEITGTGTWELPQPGVVVIDQDRRVVFAQVSPDWLVRTEVSAIIEAVDTLLLSAQQHA